MESLFILGHLTSAPIFLNKMKAIVSTISILFFTLSSHPQSFLGVTLGEDFSLVRSSDHFLSIHDDGYSSKSIFYGIRGEHYISDNLSLGLIFNYTKKEVGASAPVFIPIQSLKFSFFQGSFTLKWFKTKEWYIGFGPSMNYVSNVRTRKPEVGAFLHIKNKKEYGGILTTGYIFKNFMAEIYFIKSLTPTRDNELDFKPINSFGISLSYLFQVAKGRR